MRKIRVIILVILLLVLVIGAVLFFVGYFGPKGAGILIETNPPASVFIDGEQLGRTSYQETRKPGEVLVKLVPESFEIPLPPFETKITLVSGIETVVRRDFGNTEERSAGETLSFDRIGGAGADISILTIPDSTQITIDGETKAFAPYKTSALEPGEHLIVVIAPGYQERTVKVKTTKGYKLTAVIKLAQLEVQEVEEEISDEELEGDEKEKVTQIEILSTPTGFLRVRSEPSTLGEEIGRVTPGNVFELLEEDVETGWYKIEFEEGEGDQPGEMGWISNRYAEKLNQEEDIEESTKSAEQS